MYPVQLVNTYHTAIMNQRRYVTIHKHTGGGYPYAYNAFMQINKRTQCFVRLVSYRNNKGQCNYILSFLAYLHTRRQTYRAAGT